MKLSAMLAGLVGMWSGWMVETACAQDGDLVLQYAFEDVSAGAVDSSPYGNDGALEAIEAADGAEGGGIRLDGTGSCIRVPASASLMPGEITLAAWIWLEERPADVAPLVFKRNAGYNDNESYSLQVTPEGRARMVLGNGMWQVMADSSVQLETGRWHHVAGTFAQPRMAVYVDGALAGTASYDQPLQHQPETEVFIGSRDHLAHPMGPYLAGRLDEVRIYRRALDAEGLMELAAMGESGGPDPDSGAVDADRGTLPLEISRMVVHGGRSSDATLRWASVPGKRYTVLWSTNLMESFVVLAPDWVATGTQSVFIHRAEEIPAAYYTVRE